MVDELAPLVIRSYNIIKDQLPQSSSRPRSCSCSRKQSNQESEVADRKQDEIDKELKRIRQRETTRSVGNCNDKDRDYYIRKGLTPEEVELYVKSEETSLRLEQLIKSKNPNEHGSKN